MVKTFGQKYYIWFIVYAEARFVLGFYPYRKSEQTFALLNSVKNIRVESFKDDISNNLIESFHHQFKAWHKTKRGFNSFESTNNLISMFIFFYNFVRPYSSLNGFTPAQVARLNLTDRKRRKYILIA